jgi:Kef-type K+ transport system membrane component KefB
MVETHLFLLQLLAILLAGRLLGETATLFGIPAVIGEVAAGIIIGPSLLGWVEPNQIILILAEIGIILLLFEVGLETDVGNLLKAGKKAVAVAIGGFLAPLLLGFAATYYLFQQDMIVSLFVGGTLTATSIGITVRTLMDVHRNNSPEGQITLGAAVLDDIMGVILLALLYEFSITGEINWFNTAKVMAFVSVFFLAAPVLAKLLSHAIEFLDQRTDNPGLTPVTIISLVLFFAWLAQWFGAPQLLGGFAAGLALSRRFFLPFGVAIKSSTDFSRKIETQMKPIIQIFTPIFFVNIGLSLNLDQVNWQSAFFWIFSLSLLVVAIFGKFTGALLISEPFPRRVAIGMAMVPRGEVGLIFAGLGSVAAVFNNDMYTAIVMIIVYTTLLSPFWIKLYYRKFGHLPSLAAIPYSRDRSTHKRL